MWRHWGAAILSERDKQTIETYPIGTWECPAQSELGFFGRSGPNVAPAVTDTMNVCIHTDARLSIAQGYNQICCFAPHALKRNQRVNRTRNTGAKLADQLLTHRVNIGSLGAIESNGENGLGNLSFG